MKQIRLPMEYIDLIELASFIYILLGRYVFPLGQRWEITQMRLPWYTQYS